MKDPYSTKHSWEELCFNYRVSQKKAHSECCWSSALPEAALLSSNSILKVRFFWDTLYLFWSSVWAWWWTTHLPLELLLVRPEESCEQRDALASKKLSTPPHLVHDDSDEEEIASKKKCGEANHLLSASMRTTKQSEESDHDVENQAVLAHTWRWQCKWFVVN